MPPSRGSAVIRLAFEQLRSFSTLPHRVRQWAVGILQHTATLHCAVGSRDPVVHCHTALGSGQRGSSYTLPHCVGQWALGGLQYCSTLPHCHTAVCSGDPSVHCRRQSAVALLRYIATLLGGSGHWNSCCALPHCLGAVGGTLEVHCHTAWGQWAHCMGAVGSGQWNCVCSPLHCLRAVGSGTPAVHCHTAWVSGQWYSCGTLPHCLGAVGSGTSSVHCFIALGQWAVVLLQYTATLPRGSGQ